MYTLDRFARNRYDSAIYKARLKKNGVRIFYAKQPMPDTPEGIILESVLEGYAEYYSENLSRNIKRGMRENALNCIANGGATMLLGYTVGKDKKYAIDPVGAKIVREIYQMYADGYSATQIVNYCNAQGYKTVRGNVFSKNSLRTILSNEKYLGIYKMMDVVVPGGTSHYLIRYNLCSDIMRLHEQEQKPRKNICLQQSSFAVIAVCPWSAKAVLLRQGKCIIIINA